MLYNYIHFGSAVVARVPALAPRQPVFVYQQANMIPDLTYIHHLYGELTLKEDYYWWHSEVIWHEDEHIYDKMLCDLPLRIR